MYKFIMFVLIPLTIMIAIASCGDLPKEGKADEKVEVKMQLDYDNSTKNFGENFTERILSIF